MFPFIERFIKKRSEAAPTSAPKAPETPPSRQAEAHIAYELVQIGNDNQIITTPVDRLEDAKLQVETHCPSCGGKYPGEMGRECEYCGQSFRQIFLRPTNAQTQNSTRSANEADPKPQSRGEFGFNAPNGLEMSKDGYVIGPGASVDKLNTVRIIASRDFHCAETIIARELTIGVDSAINRVIVLSGGTARFEHGTRITYLYVGEDVTLVFGDNCIVEELLAIDLKSVKTGANFRVGSQVEISFDEFSDAYEDYK